ncbi:sensor histidine kinase [Halorientalis pallida]|uniref:histidine kinase n=1 Tax=Halorientalis pallida TaxID=2479928 RepID=A0A498KTM5_9EURY|nr:histidine kinase N-terminal 7TM domain-containing protein [Halorientalis pallida]RXK47404.1 PAS domain S-box protein [Halorientalis pallida]
MSVSPYALALGVPVVLAAAFLVETWRRCSGPGVRALRLLLCSIALWAGGSALALLAPDRAAWITFEQVAWIGRIGVPVAWALFALQYTGYGDRVTRRSVVLLALPAAVMLALVWTNPLHELVWSEVRMVYTQGVAVGVQALGPAFWAFLAYAYTLVLAGIVLVMRLVFTADHLFVDQGVALLLGVSAPLFANVASVTGAVPITGVDMTPYMFTISGITYGYAFYRSDLLDRVPATRQIGRTAVVRNMRDGVIVVDEDDVVVDVNPLAQQQFGLAKDEVVGRPVRAVFDDPEFQLPVGEGTVVWSARGPFEYEVKVSKLTDQHGHQLGRILVLRDITDRTNRRQQLQVLNRVLRHNFRNDMNVIDVCATQLVDRLDGEDAELADRVRSVACDLSETGTKAREIERIMSRRHNDPQPIDLPSLVTRQLDTLRHEYPAAEIEADLPDTLEISSTGILESVLQNVLENAVVHNDSQQPHVWVRIEADDGRVEISVADDGPGIPRQEREVLTKGTETPLEHGSGLGLWLVNWGVTMLGGDIEFRDRVAFGQDDDVSGSVVTITIPRQGPTIHTASGRPPVDAD